MGRPTTAAVLPTMQVFDPVWAAVLASPLVDDDLSDVERAGIEAAEAEIRSGAQESSSAEVSDMIDEMRRSAGE